MAQGAQADQPKVVGDFTVARTLSSDIVGHRWLGLRDSQYWTVRQVDEQRVVVLDHARKLTPAVRHQQLVEYKSVFEDKHVGTCKVADSIDRPRLSEAALIGLDLAAQLKVFVPIAKALQHLHDHDAVHGNLRPETIWVFGSGGRPQVIIDDAGLLFRGHEDHARLAREVWPWLAPEVIKASLENNADALREAAGPGADCYSLAMMLTALVGRWPVFAGCRSAEEIIARKQHDKVVFGLIAGANTIDVPGLQRLIRDATAPKVGERLASAATFAARLNEVVDSQAAGGNDG